MGCVVPEDYIHSHLNLQVRSLEILRGGEGSQKPNVLSNAPAKKCTTNNRPAATGAVRS